MCPVALPQAPWPTLQLLRTLDLQRARAEWLRGGAPGPGALALVLRNKAQLRQLGRRQLQQRFEDLRDCHLGSGPVEVLRLERDGDKDSQMPDGKGGPWHEDVLEVVGEGGHSCLGISGK